MASQLFGMLEKKPGIAAWSSGLQPHWKLMWKLFCPQYLPENQSTGLTGSSFGMCV